MTNCVKSIEQRPAMVCRTYKRIAGLCALRCLLATPGAGAEEATAPMFSLNGFGTLGAVYSSEENADFVADVFTAKGAGHTRQLSAAVDSRLGVQLVGNFASRLSATVQVITQERYDGTYTPRIEWANLKYQFTPQFSVRVGRTALASFLVSDFRKVGYANPWIRPPEEVYGLIPITSQDGVDASYRFQLGRFSHTLLAGYGKNEIKAPSGATTTIPHSLIVSDTVEYGPVTLRIAYQEAHLRIDALTVLFDAFRQFGPQGVALAERYDPTDRHATFIAVGGMYDPGAWFVTAEWGRARQRSAVGEREAWFASGGYRIGTWTPYVVHAQAKANTNTFDPGLTLSTLPPFLAGAASQLNAGLNVILGSTPVQRSTSVGARWDIRENVDLKLQFDYIDLGAGSAGTLTNLQPAFRPGGSVNLFSAAIDFVW
jgi:hypothetical protein